MTELQGVVNVPEYVLSELKKVNDRLPREMKVSRMTVRDSDFARTPSMKIARYHKV